MDGIINLNKPLGISSAQALYRVRRITGIRKSGHAGTLDPGARGVLLLCLGRATKLVERLMEQPKIYRALARLDVTSESFDSDRPLVEVPVMRVPTIDAVVAAAASFEGLIQQIPPVVSAIKVGGRRAYRLELRGQAPVLSARPARVYWVHIHAYEYPRIDFEMACGRGVYVRALIRDLGAALGVGGCLTALQRTAIGLFQIDNSCTIGELESDADPLGRIVPLAQATELLARPAVSPPRPSGCN